MHNSSIASSRGSICSREYLHTSTEALNHPGDTNGKGAGGMQCINKCAHYWHSQNVPGVIPQRLFYCGCQCSRAKAGEITAVAYCEGRERTAAAVSEWIIVIDCLRRPVSCGFGARFQGSADDSRHRPHVRTHARKRTYTYARTHARTHPPTHPPHSTGGSSVCNTDQYF